MKRFLKIAGILLLLFAITYLLVCTSFPYIRNRSGSTAPLLTTHWKQMGGFEKYTPDSLRLGCWSTALAQLAYYHRLKPYGTIRYTSRQGYRINETIDSSSVDFRKFTDTIHTADTLAAAQLALYNYHAALIVQKDFGTDRYMHQLAPASLIASHYRARVNRYISWWNFAPATLGKLEKIIVQELEEQRPVFLHFANLKDFGHSVVIDGYCYREGKFMIHTNQGQGGKDDGWYAFYKGLLRPDDTALRVIYTIEPF